MLEERCSTALDHAKKIAELWMADRAKAAESSTPVAPVLPAKPSLCYGFILRSKDPSLTGEHSDFLIESPLLKKIRKILYQRPSRSVRADLDHDIRLEYNILRTYLTAVERDDFIALFPHWKEKFSAYEEFISNVVHSIIHRLRQASLGSASREPSTKSSTAVVSKALYDHIVRYESLNPFNANSQGVVRDYVVLPEYVLLYIKAMRPRAA